MVLVNEQLLLGEEGGERVDVGVLREEGQLVMHIDFHLPHVDVHVGLCTCTHIHTSSLYCLGSLLKGAL